MITQISSSLPIGDIIVTSVYVGFDSVLTDLRLVEISLTYGFPLDVNKLFLFNLFIDAGWDIGWEVEEGIEREVWEVGWEVEEGIEREEREGKEDLPLFGT